MFGFGNGLQAVEWEWVFEMAVVEHVVALEVDGIDNIEFGMEDIEGVEGIMDHPIEEVGFDMDENEE